MLPLGALTVSHTQPLTAVSCGGTSIPLPESPWSADVGAESLTMYIVLRTTVHLTYIALFSRIIQLY